MYEAEISDAKQEREESAARLAKAGQEFRVAMATSAATEANLKAWRAANQLAELHKEFDAYKLQVSDITAKCYVVFIDGRLHGVLVGVSEERAMAMGDRLHRKYTATYPMASCRGFMLKIYPVIPNDVDTIPTAIGAEPTYQNRSDPPPTYDIEDEEYDDYE